MEETDFALLCKKESIVKEIEKAIADAAESGKLLEARRAGGRKLDYRKVTSSCCAFRKST